MLVHGRKRSLFALFSPKLWTALNQYGAGRPCIASLYEWLQGHEVLRSIPGANFDAKIPCATK
jgi:hypothetical protein